MSDISYLFSLGRLTWTFFLEPRYRQIAARRLKCVAFAIFPTFPLFSRERCTNEYIRSRLCDAGTRHFVSVRKKYANCVWKGFCWIEVAVRSSVLYRVPSGTLLGYPSQARDAKRERKRPREKFREGEESRAWKWRVERSGMRQATAPVA